MIVVTGATGHIGNVLIRELLGIKERKIKVLVLSDDDTTPLTQFPVEVVRGDILDKDSVSKVIKDAGIVYHLAGVVSIESKNDELMYMVNVEGTENVVQCCIEEGVQRLIYVSSVHALEVPAKGIEITEQAGFDPSKKKYTYEKSKAEASLKVLNAYKNGLDAVIICPTGVIGPYDFQISEMGQIIINYIGGKLRAYTDGAYDFVDVRDVAKGLISAAEKGRSGESYILSGEQITIVELLTLLQDLTGYAMPKSHIPIQLMQFLVYLMPLFRFIIKEKSMLTPYSVHTLMSNSQVSSQKARNELEFVSRPIKESIRDSIDWFRENGMI